MAERAGEIGEDSADTADGAVPRRLQEPSASEAKLVQGTIRKISLSIG